MYIIAGLIALTLGFVFAASFVTILAGGVASGPPVAATTQIVAVGTAWANNCYGTPVSDTIRNNSTATPQPLFCSEVAGDGSADIALILPLVLIAIALFAGVSYIRSRRT